MKRLLTALLITAVCLSSMAQVNAFSGEHKFDGEHRNEVAGYVMVGNNVITDAFGGLSATYLRHITDRWSVSGSMQEQFGKQLFSINAAGAYRLPVWKFDFYFSGQLLYNRYNSSGANEFDTNLSATWEGPCFEVRLGLSYINYRVRGEGTTEPLTLTFGAGVNIRPRTSKWNIGLFFRNYDDYYFENWNINWGLRFYAPLPLRMRLFGEFNIRPAGSMSQLASRYETSGKLGIKYTW